MSKSQALAAMGLGAFKVADGMLGEAEGAALSDTGFGALGGVPMILIYGAMAAEGGRQFGSGFDSFFGPDHKPANIVNDPADPSIAVNAARPLT
ncbi:hypothetical protein [Pseudonocardia spinosispora]|uniref:hypothetical protein n=1 Tax=Pseudonocardia spinosispora TaxID=103441 RepID=UPI0003F9616A|nr:hypothetical protein [Pseudonocardia spinosispora]